MRLVVVNMIRGNLEKRKKIFNQNMVKTKTKKVSLDEVPTLSAPSVESGEQNNNNEVQSRYVVVRGGIRVSDKEYDTNDDQKALDEKAFWQRVVNHYPDGTNVEIVPFDKKKHRIW